MRQEAKLVCSACGYRNRPPLPKQRCVSCGAKLDELVRASRRPQARSLRQTAFSPLWFAVSVTVAGVLTAAILVGLPRVLPVFDFEGRAGMILSIPVWFSAGLLVGLISPGRTFAEPVLATAFVAIPTAFFLFTAQTVKTMPAWLYVLFSLVGVVFALIGAYAGERVQIGPPPRSSR